VLGITTRALVQGRCGFGLETKVKDNWSLVTRIVMTYNQCFGYVSVLDLDSIRPVDPDKMTHKSRKK
jgi:hypothetical protein